jgi:hypothetical protein
MDPNGFTLHSKLLTTVGRSATADDLNRNRTSTRERRRLLQVLRLNGQLELMHHQWNLEVMKGTKMH